MCHTTVYNIAYQSGGTSNNEKNIPHWHIYFPILLCQAVDVTTHLMVRINYFRLDRHRVIAPFPFTISFEIKFSVYNVSVIRMQLFSCLKNSPTWDLSTPKVIKIPNKPLIISHSFTVITLGSCSYLYFLILISFSSLLVELKQRYGLLGLIQDICLFPFFFLALYI